MKKISIAYIIIALLFGATLLALGIYLLRFNLTQMLIDDLEDTGIAGVIIYIVLYIPLLIIRICFAVFIILGIPYLFSGVFALISVIKNNLSLQKTNLSIFLIVNSILLFFVHLTDITIVYVACKNMISSSVPFIVFTVLISVLCVALEIISAIGYNKLWLMNKERLFR